MKYIDDATSAMFRGDLHLGIFLALYTDPPVRLWTGINEVLAKHPLDGTDVIYIGRGEITNMPGFDAVLSGNAERADFKLEGVSADAVAQIEQVNPILKGERFVISVMPFDANWQRKLTTLVGIAQGNASYWALDLDATQDPPQQSLSLSVGFGATGRTRRRLTTFTDAQTKFEHPTDDFCHNVAKYNAGYIMTWPRF